MSKKIWRYSCFFLEPEMSLWSLIAPFVCFLGHLNTVKCTSNHLHTCVQVPQRRSSRIR